MTFVVPCQQEGSEQQKLQVVFDVGIQGRNLAHIAGNQGTPQMIAPPRFRVHVVFNQPVPKTPETLQVILHQTEVLSTFNLCT